MEKILLSKPLTFREDYPGIKGTDSAAAISWANWGQKVNGVTDAREGDVVVIQNRQTGQHHVGFLVQGNNGSVRLLGGNQSDTVKESDYSLGTYSIVAIRRPAEQTVTA